MKKKILIIITFLITMILTSIASAYAANYLYNSNEVYYDNSESKITSSDVQGAIDELYTEATNYSSINTRVTALETLTGTNTLTTTNKTLTGAVNELKSKKLGADTLINIYDNFYTEHTLTSSKKISDYTLLGVYITLGGAVGTFPVGLDYAYTFFNYPINGFIKYNGNFYTVTIKYVSDTSVSVSSDYNGAIVITMIGLV